MRKFALLIILTAVAVIAGLGLPSQLRTAAFNLGMLSEEIAISGTGSMQPVLQRTGSKIIAAILPPPALVIKKTALN